MKRKAKSLIINLIIITLLPLSGFLSCDEDDASDFFTGFFSDEDVEIMFVVTCSDTTDTIDTNFTGYVTVDNKTMYNIKTFTPNGQSANTTLATWKFLNISKISLDITKSGQDSSIAILVYKNSKLVAQEILPGNYPDQTYTTYTLSLDYDANAAEDEEEATTETSK